MPAGTRLMDYDIEGLLGVGGFGLVYRAHDAALQRTVAIKEYLPSSLAMRGDQGEVVLRAPQHEEPFALGLRSFINEARLLARFDHPSLVKVFRFWEAHGTAYMVMPCYDGPTLYDARRQLDAPPQEAWLRALMDPLLGALDCLHREHVFHRDVAPDNILVVPDPDAPQGIRPVLLDFGAARRVISENTQALTAILKPSFAPIEQYAETTQLRQGPWTDLYGLAAVLHYCVTGRTPVPATARAVHDDLPVLRHMASALAQDFGISYSLSLLSTIDRALSVRPDGRPESVAAWRDSLLRPPPDEAGGPPAGASGADAADAAGTAGQRAVWSERTIMVTPTAEQPHSSSFPTTHALAASGLFGGPHPRAAKAWPRGLVWGGGALLLATVVALSGWSVNRHQREQAAAGPTSGSVIVAADAAQGGQPGQDAGKAGRQEAVRRVVDERAGAVPADPSASRKPVGGVANDEQRAEGARRGGRERPSDNAGPLNPRQACGSRVFIALAICMKRHCGKPQYSQHAECARMRQQEEAQRSRHDFP